jgi:hypothetical protein
MSQEQPQSTRPELNWWSRIIQNQLATIIALIFMCGGLYVKIGVMEENLHEMKEELKLVRQLDKANELLKIRVNNLEEFKRSVEQWKRDEAMRKLDEALRENGGSKNE